MLMVKVYRVRDADDAYDTLKRIDNQYEGEEKRLLVDLPNNEAEKLLKLQASQIKAVFDLSLFKVRKVYVIY